MSGQPHLELYVDADGDHRWRIKGGNGEVIAACTEGYRDPRDRDESIRLCTIVLAGGRTARRRGRKAKGVMTLNEVRRLEES